MTRLAISVEGTDRRRILQGGSNLAPAIAWYRSATHPTWACTWTQWWRQCQRGAPRIGNGVAVPCIRRRDFPRRISTDFEKSVRGRQKSWKRYCVRKFSKRLARIRIEYCPTSKGHEFEGLLFSDVDAFSALIETPPESVDFLRNIRSSFATPEDINDDTATAPSQRIKTVIARYRKPLHGPLVAMRIGLDAIRAECPRINNWMISLEALQGRT